MSCEYFYQNIAEWLLLNMLIFIDSPLQILILANFVLIFLSMQPLFLPSPTHRENHRSNWLAMHNHDEWWLHSHQVICATGISVLLYAIEYVNWLAPKPVGAWMIGTSDAREGAAGHATVPEDWQKGDRLLRCKDELRKEWNHMYNCKGFGRGKSAPL